MPKTEEQEMQQEANFDVALERVTEATTEMATDTLRGDVRTAMLDRIRNMPKPWEKMSEAEQRAVNEGIDRVAEDIIERAVKLIASDGRHTVVVKLEQVTIKDGVKGVFTCTKKQDTVAALGVAEGSEVLVVLADSDKFMGQREPAKADPDQPDMLPEATEADADNEAA